MSDGGVAIGWMLVEVVGDAVVLLGVVVLIWVIADLSLCTMDARTDKSRDNDDEVDGDVGWPLIEVVSSLVTEATETLMAVISVLSEVEAGRRELKLTEADGTLVEVASILGVVDSGKRELGLRDAVEPLVEVASVLRADEATMKELELIEAVGTLVDVFSMLVAIEVFKRELESIPKSDEPICQCSVGRIKAYARIVSLHLGHSVHAHARCHTVPWYAWVSKTSVLCLALQEPLHSFRIVVKSVTNCWYSHEVRYQSSYCWRSHTCTSDIYP